MATRKIVPRADNEGGIGTALKRWASAFINALTADSATIGTLSGIVKAAAGVLSATALGSADQKFFMNAAGNAPEWATGNFVGTFTRDVAAATGNVSYTGVGFKPSAIIFFVNITATVKASFGFNKIGVALVIALQGDSTWGQWAGYSIFILTDGSNWHAGVIASFDADGFTITWTKTGAKTGTANIYYMAFR